MTSFSRSPVPWPVLGDPPSEITSLKTNSTSPSKSGRTAKVSGESGRELRRLGIDRSARRRLHPRARGQTEKHRRGSASHADPLQPSSSRFRPSTSRCSRQVAAFSRSRCTTSAGARLTNCWFAELLLLRVHQLRQPRQLGAEPAALALHVDRVAQGHEDRRAVGQHRVAAHPVLRLAERQLRHLGEARDRGLLPADRAVAGARSCVTTARTG